MQGEGLKKLQSGQPISTRELLLLIAQLSWPAILAQISSVVMQYIDTAMVGQLGSYAITAVGLTNQPKFLMLSVWWRPPRGSSAICALR